MLAALFSSIPTQAVMMVPHGLDIVSAAEGEPGTAPAPRNTAVGPNRYAALKAQAPAPVVPDRRGRTYSYRRSFPHLNAA